ncbi:MAG: TerD family protein [Candidatus Melainabacteria bacterium]|nr:TerD family protein [Candidatus Melainabacteria bacterium]
MSQNLAAGGNAPVPTEKLTVKCMHIGPDADLSALLLTQAGKVRTDEDFVFYGQPKSTCGSVAYQDKLKNGEITEHAIVVDLAKLPAAIEKIAITLTIDPETPKTFAAVTAAGLSVHDAAGKQLVEMEPRGDKENAFVIAEIYKRNGAWKVRNFNQGFVNGLAGIATAYGVDVGDSAPAPAPVKAAAPPPPPPAVPKVNLTKPAPTGKVSLSKGKSIKIEKTPEIIATGEWSNTWRKTLDYDLFAHIAYKDGRQEVINFDRLSNKDGSVRHHGDLKTGGSGTIERVTVKMTDEIAAVGFSFYSARENGQGSFSDARARVSIDNGNGSTIVIQVQQMSVDPRRYTLYFGTCINRDGDAVEIVAHEDYSARDSENQALLYKDGTHKMDAGRENRTK